MLFFVKEQLTGSPVAVITSLASHLASPLSRHGSIAFRRLLDVTFSILDKRIVFVMSLNGLQCCFEYIPPAFDLFFSEWRSIENGRKRKSYRPFLNNPPTHLVPVKD